MYEEFRYRVKASYLEHGDLCFRVGAEKTATNQMRCITNRDPYASNRLPWFEFVNKSSSGWSFDEMLTDHPVYSEGWEYPGDGTRRTKFYLVSEEV